MIDEEIKTKAKELRQKGLMYDEIAKELNISKSMAYRLVNEEKYRQQKVKQRGRPRKYGLSQYEKGKWVSLKLSDGNDAEVIILLNKDKSVKAVLLRKGRSFYPVGE